MFGSLPILYRSFIRGILFGRHPNPLFVAKMSVAFNASKIIHDAASAAVGRRETRRRSTMRRARRNTQRRQKRALQTKAIAQHFLEGLAILASCSRFKYKVTWLNHNSIVQIVTSLSVPGRDHPAIIEITPSTISVYGLAGGRARRFKNFLKHNGAASALAFITSKVAADESMQFSVPKRRPFRASSASLPGSSL